MWLCAEGIRCDGGSCGCVLRASGVMGEAVVVCLMRTSGVMGVSVFVCLMRASGVMGVSVFVC